MEFYIELFDLLRVVEEVRTSRRMTSGLNATFISLIPKHECLESFDRFRPISLCNCLYKITAKVIATILNPILSKYISTGQFGFIQGRQIHEAMVQYKRVYTLLNSLTCQQQ